MMTDVGLGVCRVIGEKEGVGLGEERGEMPIVFSVELSFLPEGDGVGVKNRLNALELS